MSADRSAIHVVAGAVFDKTGLVLIAQRPPGKHMAGSWEFPGGKLQTGETPPAALKRELKEELDIDVLAASPVTQCVHDYPDRRVLLDLWRISKYVGIPKSMDAQALRWVKLEDLDDVGLLPADKPLVEALRLVCGGVSLTNF